MLEDKVRAVIMANPVRHGQRGLRLGQLFIVIERNGQMVAYFDSGKLEPVPPNDQFLVRDDPCLPVELQVGRLVLPSVWILETAVVHAKRGLTAKNGQSVVWPRGVELFNSRVAW